MDHLLAKGFQPGDMALVTAALFQVSKQYLKKTAYPELRDAFKTDQITPEDEKTPRSTAPNKAAIALKRCTRCALESVFRSVAESSKRATHLDVSHSKSRTKP